MRCIVPYCLPSRATTCKGALNVANVQNKIRVTSGLNLPWYGSMEWNMEENFSMEWNMELNIFSMEWKWNGRFLVWNGNGMEENCQYEICKNRLPLHTMPW